MELSVEPNMVSPRSFCFSSCYTSVSDLSQSIHLIAVKVLDDSGSGYISDILAGLEWVIDAVGSCII